MKITNIEASSETFEYENIKQDYDRYMLYAETPMSHQEFTVIVNHIDKTISGDAIRYGSWDDIEPEEVEELLTAIYEAGEVLRDYTGYVVK